MEPLLRRLRDEGTNPALCGVLFAGPLTARVLAFADDITVFVSRRLDIKAVNKAVGEYERIAGANANFDKSEGLRLGAWRGKQSASIFADAGMGGKPNGEFCPLFSLLYFCIFRGFSPIPII